MSINFCFMYFEALLLDINNYDCFVFLMNCTVIILKCFFFAPVVISVLQFLPPDINIVTLVFLHLSLIFYLHGSTSVPFYFSVYISAASI